VPRLGWWRSRTGRSWWRAACACAAGAGLPAAAAAAVSPFLACIGSPWLRHCVHGASIGGGGGERRRMLAWPGWLDNAASFDTLAPLLVQRLGLEELVACDPPGALSPPSCVSIYLDKNRHYIGKSQSKRRG
jgi:hypothetical protein